MSRRPLAALLAACTLGTAPAAQPAPQALPLFRQALEQGVPAVHEVILLHHGELSAEDQDRQQALEEARRRSSANATLHSVDLEGPADPVLASLWPGQDPPDTPWVVVRAPGPATNAPVLWTGPLRAPLLDHLFESPARQRIAEGLLQGATAMWILLECGETARDEAAVDTLTSSLRALEKQWKPPARGASRSPLPLRIDFGLVRVTRSDLAEEFLVHLLDHGAPALQARPLAFAVYGRGRLLGPLVGRDLDADGIRGLCQRLVAPPAAGEAGLPGRDLLMGADWNRVFQPVRKAAKSPVSAGAPADLPAQRGMLPLWLQWAGGTALATAVGAALWARRRRRA